MSEREEDHEKFGVVDLIRLLGGVLLLNALASYWFTNSTMWGVKLGRYLDLRYYQYLITGEKLNITMGELLLFDGSDPKLPIYVGVNGVLFDVTASRNVYGPGGSYHGFAGNDGARLFHNGCFHRKDQLTYDLRGLDHDTLLQDIENWRKFYQSNRNYWQVGHVIHDELVGEPPAVCNGLKYPGH